MAVVLISGGTGLIGKKLTSHLIERNYDVIILTRNKKDSSSNLKLTFSFWDVKKQIIDSKAIQKADHIIHLAGAGVMDKKWTKHYKKEIIEIYFRCTTKCTCSSTITNTFFTKTKTKTKSNLLNINKYCN